MSANPPINPLAMRRALMSAGRDSRWALMNRNTRVTKVENTKFLGDAPKSAPECKLALPGNASAEDFIDDNDPTTKKTLDDIRSKYNVWVKTNRGDRFVTLSGESIKSLNLAKDALRVFLLGINQDIQSKMIILTHHSIAATQALVEIKPNSHDSSSYRPVALVIPVEEDLIDLSDDAEEENETNFEHGLDGQGPKSVADTDTALGNLTGDLVDQFGVAIQETGKRLRPAAGQLRVRAHMGVFTVKKRQAKTDKYQSDEALKKFLDTGADRGYIFVGHKLGNECWAARMLDIIYGTEDLDNPTTAEFLPADPTALSLRDIKPKFTLVLFAKDLKIEVDVMYDAKYRPRPETGSVRAFSFNRDKVAEVAVSCPNRKFDWHLSVEAESPKSRIPAEVFDFIARGLEFKRPIPTDSEINDDFPFTEVNAYLLRAASIDNVACKVFRTFQTANTPYCLEVSVYHEWGAGFFQETNPIYPWKALNTAAVPRPIKSCGISLYGQDWDHKIRDINKPGGGRQADFANGFPDLFVNEDSSSSIEQFLQEMQRLHDFTELAML
ncbi:hypothetical protein LA080_001151 [Diaporthe eres]|nr:hypothetical protein LA080_001151 [Diaporthe eres]